MALILGIETATDVCSVSLSRNGETFALRESTEDRDHARNLAVFISELLESNALASDDLDAVALSMGPGSYTGLRIGAATAKGLCYSLEIPLIGIGSLESLARVAVEDIEAGICPVEQGAKYLLCPMIDARRMEVYAQVFDESFQALTQPLAEIIEPDSFSEFITEGRPLLIFGNGAAKTTGVLRGEGFVHIEVTPSARGLAVPAYEAYRNKDYRDVAYFEPYYLKDFVAKTSEKKMW